MTEAKSGANLNLNTSLQSDGEQLAGGGLQILRKCHLTTYFPRQLNREIIWKYELGPAGGANVDDRQILF